MKYLNGLLRKENIWRKEFTVTHNTLTDSEFLPLKAVSPIILLIKTEFLAELLFLA
jgi:hypothetical protein